MFRKRLVLVTLIALASWTCDLQAGQIASTWVGGPQGEWGNASNWNPAIVPDNAAGNTFRVTIDAGGGRVDIGLQQNRTIDQLDCYGNVVLGPWTPFRVQLTLVDPNGLTNYEDLVIWCEGLRMQIKGNVTNTEWAMLALSRVEIHANLYNLADATVRVWRDTEVKGDLENAGTVRVISSRGLWIDSNVLNTGQIWIDDGDFGTAGIFDNDSNGVINGYGVIRSDGLFDNKGEITAYGGSLVLWCNEVTNTGTLSNMWLSSLQFSSATDVHNVSTITIRAGGSVGIGHTLVNEPSGIINLWGGTLASPTITQSAGATFEGGGDIMAATLIIETNGLIRLTGPTNIFGDVNIAPGATLAISDGTTLITGQTTCNGTIHMKGGRIIPQGGLSGDCNVIWEPGTYSNIADFNLDGQVNFEDFAYFADTWLWRSAWR